MIQLYAAQKKFSYTYVNENKNAMYQNMQVPLRSNENGNEQIVSRYIVLITNKATTNKVT